MFILIVEALKVQGDYLVRIFVSAICGGLIGYERSRRQKEAGIRTHIIVALGSALIMIVSKYGFFDVVQYEGISCDASRLAANIITGISFLGAGVIFLKNDCIVGLTTAAGVWATSGVGLCIGCGMYGLGIITTIFMVILQVVLHKYLPSSERIMTKQIVVIMDEEINITDQIKDVFRCQDFMIQSYQMTKNSDGTLTLRMTIRTSEIITMEESIEFIRKNKQIRSLIIK